MLKLDSIPKINPDIVGRVVDNEAVIVLPQKGKVKVLNEVGAFIWEQCNGSRSIQDIAKGICGEFEVNIETAEQDVLDFIADLINREVVSLS